jgi:hypothetical protein
MEVTVMQKEERAVPVEKHQDKQMKATAERIEGKAEEFEASAGELGTAGKLEAPAGKVEAAQEAAASAEELDAAQEPAAISGELSAAQDLDADEDVIRVSFEESEADAAALRAKAEEIKVKIAQKVRADSQESYAVTSQDSLIDLDDYLRYGRIDVSALLTEMTSEEPFLDIKVITTATGLVYLYSETYITAENATIKSLIEEAKSILSGAIRADSYQYNKLTPIVDIYAMAPDTEPVVIDALLRGMATEARFADIKTITDANGALYLHSDRYLTRSYADTLILAMAGNHHATIVETVREESRIYPRTTNIAIFSDQAVYGIPPKELDTIVYNVLRKPEYSDIKRIVHPVTRAIHLYSDRYIVEQSAWAMMDWEEVGRANNP